MSCYVIGSGGNGQTYFMEFLNKNNIITNHVKDNDGLKHKPKPIYGKKYIFLFNHPLKSILSHYRRSQYRRKWVPMQICKLGNPYKLKLNLCNNFYLLQKTTIDMNCDIFGIKSQFDNFINYEGDILFIDFNEILDNKKKINTFLNKELDYSIFKFKKRSINKINVNRIFSKIYDDLYFNMKNKAEEKNLSNNL